MIRPLISLRPELSKIKYHNDIIVGGRTPAPQWNLICLMSSLHRLECTVPRDRIFSLLSMCAKSLIVDADYENPSSDLALSIFKQCKDTLCICSIQMIGNRLSSDERVVDFTQLAVHFAEMEIHRWVDNDIERVPRKHWREISVPTQCSSGPDRAPKLRLHRIQYYVLPTRLPIYKNRYDSDCEMTTAIVVLLEVRAVVVAESAPDDFEPHLSFLGEEIQVPDHLKVYMSYITSLRKLPPDGIRLFANGFSFGQSSESTLGSNCTLRILITHLWKIISEKLPNVLWTTLNKHRPCSSPRLATLGHGHWNITTGPASFSSRSIIESGYRLGCEVAEYRSWWRRVDKAVPRKSETIYDIDEDLLQRPKKGD